MTWIWFTCPVCSMRNVSGPVPRRDMKRISKKPSTAISSCSKKFWLIHSTTWASNSKQLKLMDYAFHLICLKMATKIENLNYWNSRVLTLPCWFSHWRRMIPSFEVAGCRGLLSESTWRSGAIVASTQTHGIADWNNNIKGWL